MTDNVVKIKRKPRPLRKTYQPKAPYEVERDPNAAYTKHTGGDPDQSRYIRWMIQAGKEAATAIDALNAFRERDKAEIESLRRTVDNLMKGSTDEKLIDEADHLRNDVREVVLKLGVSNARVKELEAGWHDCITELTAEKRRALRAEQQRDEAYAFIRDVKTDSYLDDYEHTYRPTSIAEKAGEFFRRLAAGTEKEGE